MARNQATILARGCVMGCIVKTVVAFGAAATGESGVEARLRDVVEANIIATHAYQVNLAIGSGKGDPVAWTAGGVGTNDLAALVQHQERLLMEPPEAIAAWVRGQPSAFDSGKDLAPILASPLRASATNLPVNVLAAYIGKHAPVSGLQARALASLLQLMTDVERDGTLLQGLFALYTALGLPVHTAQAGWKETSDAEFLAVAERLSPAFCACPFDTDPATLRMIFRKLWNWGHRYTGERDKAVLARELMAEPEVAALLPALKALPAQKIAVIGHSFTMNLHWASPSAFVPVAAEVLSKVNPKVEVRQWQAGGMNAARADCQVFYKEALAWKPDRVLLVIANRGTNDPPALETMVAGFVAQGVKVAMFENIYGDLRPDSRFYWEPKLLRGLAQKTGMDLIPCEQAIDTAPERSRFLSLDGIHMTEPYHRLMARLWLSALAGARKD